MWEKQREKECRGDSHIMGPWSEISHEHKRRRNEQEQKQTGTEGGRQINKAGEGREPQSYQAQAFLRREGTSNSTREGDLNTKLNQGESVVRLREWEWLGTVAMQQKPHSRRGAVSFGVARSQAAPSGDGSQELEQATEHTEPAHRCYCEGHLQQRDFIATAVPKVWEGARGGERRLKEAATQQSCMSLYTHMLPKHTLNSTPMGVKDIQGTPDCKLARCGGSHRLQRIDPTDLDGGGR